MRFSRNYLSAYLKRAESSINTCEQVENVTEKEVLRKIKRGQIPGRISIENRSKIVEEKVRNVSSAEPIGDIEMDLVIGKNHKKAILTAVDRASGKGKIALLNTESAQEMREKSEETLSEWMDYLQTITSDNGKET